MTKITKSCFLLFLFCIGLAGGIHAQTQSSDAKLKSLAVDKGTLSPAFDAAVTDYTVSVANNVSSINITAEANDTKATMVGDGIKTLVTGKNPFTITVTAEDATTKDYKITVTRAPYKITASVKNNYGGTITPSGSINVNAGSDTTFKFTALDSYELHSITINGNPYEGDGDSINSYTFSNIQGDSTIMISFVSTNDTLKSLTTNRGLLTPIFSPEETEYTINVADSINDIKIDAVAMNNAATVGGDVGVSELTTGENWFTIIGIAENGSMREYLINVIRAPFTIISSVRNNRGGTILDSVGKVEIAMDSSLTYTFVPEDGFVLKEVLVDGIADTNAVKNQSHTFNNVSKNHTIEAFFASMNANLADIRTSGGVLQPSFNRDSLNYTITVDNDIDVMTLTGIVEQDGAVVVGNISNESLNIGKNTFELLVTAEAEEVTRKYVIIVDRLLSPIATLKSLTISEGEGITPLMPDFNPDITEYTINVERSVDAITLIGVATHEDATVRGNVTDSPLYNDIGDNLFQIEVTAADKVAKKIYTITVVRGMASDATMKNLTFSEGDLTPAFDPNITNYTLNVANTIDKITLSGEANHAGATVDGPISNEALAVGFNTFNLTVTAENKVTQITYTINVIRGSSSDATLKSLIVNKGKLTPDFISSIKNYKIDVANDETSITITGVANDSVATVSGNVTKADLNVGENVFDIICTAQDLVSEETYRVVVTRAGATDANMKSISVSVGSLSPTFLASRQNYTVNVENSVTSISITGTANHAQASVQGNVIDYQLVTGENKFELVVFAEDVSETKTYTVVVNRAKSTDANLQNLVTDKGILMPAFNPDTLNYTIDLDRDTETISIEGLTNHADASITGNITDAELTLGYNMFNIVVLAEDGTTRKYYSVNVNRVRSSDANLENLITSKGILIPDFDMDILDYTINVDNATTSISLTGIVNHEGAIVKDTMDAELNTGENIFTIEVTAEDETTKKYNITVVRAKSVNADLQSLTISKGTLSPTFNANTTRYNVEVPDNTTTITINAISSHIDAVVEGNITGAALNVGDNIFEVNVTAEDGITTKKYTIVVVKKQTVGIDDVEVPNELTVYPNPVKDIVYIKSVEQIQYIQIYSVNGRLIKQVLNVDDSINVSDFAKGIYLMKIITSKGETIKKIVKE